MRLNEVIRPSFRSVLVTGAAGFIGSRVVKLLTQLGCVSIALDNEAVGLPLQQAGPLVHPVRADIRDRPLVRDTLSQFRPDAVLHLAALHHIPTCEARPWDAFDVNVMGTQTLLDECAAAGVANFVLASSGAVYDWEDGYLSEDSSTLRARDVYSTTKLTNEYQVAVWAERNDHRAHVARIFNTIGVNDPNGHLIPDLMKQMRTGSGPRTVRLGNTAPKRDYIFVDDTAAGLVTILSRMAEGARVEAFNLCSGREVSVAGLTELLGEVMGVQVSVEPDPARMRKLDRLGQLGDPSKMKDRYGWSARLSLRDALREIALDAESTDDRPITTSSFGRS